MKMPTGFRFLVVAACAVVLLTLTGACQQPAPQAPPDTRVADETALRNSDVEFSNATAARDLQRAVSYYTIDASALPPGAPIATGSDAIRKLFSDMLATPGFSISWQPAKVEVARSGDLGYTMGTYRMGMTGPDGKPVEDRGKYVTVWKKQADGSWKVVSDIFNSDLPPVPPPVK